MDFVYATKLVANLLVLVTGYKKTLWLVLVLDSLIYSRARFQRSLVRLSRVDKLSLQRSGRYKRTSQTLFQDEWDHILLAFQVRYEFQATATIWTTASL